jgi:hypothetical protein
MASAESREGDMLASFRGVVLGLICLLASTAASAEPGLVSGRWEGAYSYPDNSQPPVPFVLEVQVRGDSFTGRTSEPATFGEGSSPKLYARVQGRTSGTDVSFTKTYDGTNGVSHSVDYRGTISADGSRMTGTWHIGNFSGSFQASVLDRAR